MPEYRHDPVTGRCVIVAPDRAGRPDEFQHVPRRRRDDAACPFCAGNEAMTPAVVATYGEGGADHDPWQVRVVENKYPAVQLGEIAHASEPSWHEASAAYGKHEVVIESPRHVASIGSVRDHLVELTMQVYRDRVQSLAAANGHEYVHIFKNVGSDAGASIEHSHTQIVALPEVPAGVMAELAGARHYFDRHGSNVFLDLLAEERKTGERIVAETDRLVAFCPFASRFPFETWIMRSDQHSPSFESSSDGVLVELASLVKRIVCAAERVLNLPAYNYWIHNSPFDRSWHDHYHWHMEFMPRITTPAGFEWGAGMHINPVAPEAAAGKLRSAMEK